MTFEEMQKTIEGILAVQQELQRSQLAFKQDLTDLRDTLEVQSFHIEQLQSTVTEQTHNINRLIGYSITNESEHLDIEERFRELEKKISQLERDS